jgi:hypothetical protein
MLPRRTLRAMTDLNVPCGNDICNCTVSAPVDGGVRYCSDYCQDVTDQSIESESCSCGHPPCDEP